MKTERRHHLKEGDELTTPATLFLYVLKILKEKNSFDSIRTGKFEEVIRSIFGNGYVDNDWKYIRSDLIGNGWIDIFSGLVEKDELYRFIKITKEREWLITNGVPGDWIKDVIDTAVKNLKIKDDPVRSPKKNIYS